MKTDRRDFFKKTSVAGLGLVSAGLGCSRQSESRDPFPQTHRQRFNMAGYSAPQLDLVRIGVIGIGERGRGTVMQLGSIEGVEIRALCDLEPERVKRGAELILDLGHKPDLYSGGEEEWKKVCDRSDIDVIAIVTPWHLHTIQAAYAMEHDKHVYTQLTAANTIDECWQLVETSERTRKHCTQTSASCHSGIHAVNLNMVRQGFFGLLIHAEGNYIHQLNNKEYFWNPDKGKFHRQWRLNQNIGRQGNLYAGHGFTPIVQMMHINYGDKIDYISSFQSNDFSMNETAKIMSDEDDFWKPWLNRDYRGNMNTSVMRTVKGRTIVIQHDTSSPRPRPGGLVSGTKAIYTSFRSFRPPDRYALSDPDYGSWDGRGWLSEEETNSLIEKYTPAIVKKYNELVTQVRTREAKRTGRRSLPYYRIPDATDWRFIDCLRNGLPMDRDVYEAATTSAIIPLSEWSVANRSNSVTYPDFTCGAWETNPVAMDIELNRGGTTGLK